MKIKQFIPLIIAAFQLLNNSIIKSQELTHKEQIIQVMIDMNMDTDVEDLGALATLHALADNGEVKILSTTCSTTNNWSAPCISVINNWYKRPKLPVGMLKAQVNLGSSQQWPGYSFNRYLVDHFAGRLKSVAKIPDACTLMRKTLASSRGKIRIIVTGGSVNLRYLLESKPDNFSKLNGHDLIKEKVNFIVMVGGGYPIFKQEYNFVQDLESTRKVVLNWPTPIYYCGYQLGADIKTGQHLNTWCTSLNLVRIAYQKWDNFFQQRWNPAYQEAPIRPHGSWDQVAVLFAVKGTGKNFKLSPAGRNFIKSNGTTEWVPYTEGKDYYIQRNAPQKKIAFEIERLMAQLPGRNGIDH